ncbi:MAG TPA: glycosyltransferase [Bryobacteraceae bacterium]|nr:glycosyltransferase [Bryobacteraceae bacterium]
MGASTKPRGAEWLTRGAWVPYISVVIPAYNAAGYLKTCLASLSASSYRDYECIVVDDGSTDDSSEVARRFGARVVRTEGRRGPAYARNLGAYQASGEVLFFIDSDVAVYEGTLSRVASHFMKEQDLTAVIGSYDDSPGSADFMSQYRNLMHCYVHQTSHAKACTFWSGCGAIRRDAFLEFGGFDAGGYNRPAIEDIELGYRLSGAGRQLRLDRNLLVKHLKKWTVWSVVRTDVRDRGIPWTELILRDQNLPNDLNVQRSQRISVALVFLMLGLAGLTSIVWGAHFLVPLFGLMFFLLARYWVDSRRKTRRELLCLTAAVAGVSATGYAAGLMPVVYAVLLGYALVFLRDRYAYQAYSRRRLTGVLLGCYMAFAAVFILRYLPNSPMVFGFFALLAALIALNHKFYLFLAVKRGRLFALTAIPFHLLYHFYNGLSFGVGLTRHLLRVRTLKGARSATGQAKPRVAA